MKDKYPQRDDTNVSLSRDILLPSAERELKGVLGGAVLGGLMFGAGMIKHKLSPKIMANSAKTIPKNIKTMGKNYGKFFDDIATDVTGDFANGMEDLVNKNASTFEILKSVPKQYSDMSKKVKPAFKKGIGNALMDGVDFGENTQGFLKTVALGGVGFGLGAELTEMGLRNKELNDLNQQYLGEKPKALDYIKMHAAGAANLGTTVGLPIPLATPVRIATKMYTEPAAIVQRKRRRQNEALEQQDIGK